MKTAALGGGDALSSLIDIYMSGLTSGWSSALYGYGMSGAEADAISNQVADGMSKDPLIMDEVERQVMEILAGADSGPKTVNVVIPVDPPA